MFLLFSLWCLLRSTPPLKNVCVWVTLEAIFMLISLRREPFALFAHLHCVHWALHFQQTMWTVFTFLLICDEVYERFWRGSSVWDESSLIKICLGIWITCACPVNFHLNIKGLSTLLTLQEHLATSSLFSQTVTSRSPSKLCVGGWFSSVISGLPLCLYQHCLWMGTKVGWGFGTLSQTTAATAMGFISKVHWETKKMETGTETQRTREAVLHYSKT